MSRIAINKGKGEREKKLNQAVQDWHTRVVTLSEAKGLGLRFFAMLRMTFLKSFIVKCTNVLHSGLAHTSAFEVGLQKILAAGSGHARRRREF